MEMKETNEYLRRRSCRIGLAIALFGCMAAALSFAQVNVVEEKAHKTLPEQPLKLLNESAQAPQGRLLYTAAVHFEGQPGRKTFLLLRRTGQGDVSKGIDATYHAQIPIELPVIVFDTQFSADGRYILFKAGWPYDNPRRFKLYLWDLKMQKLMQPGPNEAVLTYQWVRLSPDNKYLAYCFGGDNQGNNRGENRTAPLELAVYNLQNKKQQLIAKNPAAKQFSWSSQGDLLFSQIDEKAWRQETDKLDPAKKVSGASEHNGPTPAARPDIYEASPPLFKPKLLFRDGYYPVSSPDGKWIACFTSSQPEKETLPSSIFNPSYPTQSYLCVYDRSTGKRHIIQPVWGTFPQLKWTPDSKNLLVLRSTYQARKGKGFISAVKIPELTKTDIATLEATDSEELTWGDDKAQFRMLAVSHGQIVVSISEVQETAPQDIFLNITKTLKSIDLQNEKQITIAKIYNWQAGSLGLDWQAEAP